MEPLGPPPRKPAEPEVIKTSHVLHLLLSLLTFGMWAVIWVLVVIRNTAYSDKLAREYRAELDKWEREWWAWEQERMRRYGPSQYPGAV